MRRSWSAIILAVILGLIGVVLIIGGAWLLSLGGSAYYAIAGIVLLASAWLVFRGRTPGGRVYIGLFVLTAIWGFRIARRGLGDGAVAGRPAGYLLIFVPAGHANAHSGSEPVEARWRRNCALGGFSLQQSSSLPSSTTPAWPPRLPLPAQQARRE